jgi:hypothetical protein
MATAGTINLDSTGSLTLRTIPLTTVANNDTYASGIQAVVGYWASVNTTQGTQGAEGCDVYLSTASSGTFTFYTNETKARVTLFVLSRG